MKRIQSRYCVLRTKRDKLDLRSLDCFFMFTTGAQSPIEGSSMSKVGAKLRSYLEHYGTNRLHTDPASLRIR